MIDKLKKAIIDIRNINFWLVSSAGATLAYMFSVERLSTTSFITAVLTIIFVNFFIFRKEWVRLIQLWYKGNCDEN